MTGTIALATPIPLGWWLAAAYGALGVALALALHRAGHPASTTVSALAAWPLLIPLAIGTAPSPAPVARRGPLAHRIGATLGALRNALADPAVAGLATGEELAGLERVLRAADTRLGLVDRILVDAETDDPAVRRSAERLESARSRSAAEIESVLSELEQLRLHAAMMVLSGDASAVRDRVRQLLGRARAIEEVATIATAPDHPRP